MKVTVHIDRLIVEGAPLGRRERATLLATIERRLREQLDGTAEPTDAEPTDAEPTDVEPTAATVAPTAGAAPGRPRRAPSRADRIAAHVATAVHGEIGPAPALSRPRSQSRGTP
jgi:hypothetical protein